MTQNMQGTIIEYIEHGRFICAAVMEHASGRLHLLNQNGREVSLPPARVIHQSARVFTGADPREHIIQILKETDNTRLAMQLPVSLHELWELTSEESELEFAPRFLAELCFGEPATDHQTAVFLRAIFEDKIYFKYRGETIQAHSPAVVAQLLERRAQERRMAQTLRMGAAAIKAVWHGEEPAEWPEQDCLELLREYYLFDKEAAEWELARELIKLSGLTGPHDIYHLLVKAGRWPRHQNIPVLRHRVPVEFSAEAIAQAQSIVAAEKSIISSTNRHDLRQLPVLTIDGTGTRDFDDALHVARKGDNFEVGIHISDVALHIVPRSPLFKEAEERATSIYFPDANIPMLPHELSEGALSLLAGEDRAAISFLVTLTPDGELINAKIVQSLIHVKRQLTYNNAESLLPNDQELQDLVMLSQQLRQNRIKEGALIIPVPDVVFRFDHGDVTDVLLSDADSTMRLLVAEFMVLANRLGAKFLADKQEPGLYRTQEPARKRFFVQPEKDLFINFRQRRFLARGQLLTTPKRHDSVGAEQYTTVTSPIRRLLDLVIQHQIASILAGQGAIFSEVELNEFASKIAIAQSRVNLVRQLRHRYWLFQYLGPKQGTRFPAFVLDKRNQKLQVVLKDFLLEGELPVNQAMRLELGDTLMVKVAKVDALENVIRLEW